MFINFQVCGGGLVGIGLWLRFDEGINQILKETIQLELVELPHNIVYTGAYVLIAAGAFIFVAGFCGCCGAIRESFCMLGVVSIHNFICICFTTLAVFMTRLYAQLWVRVGITLTCGKHVQDRTITSRGKVWTHNASLILPLFIEVPVPRQESERSCF